VRNGRILATAYRFCYNRIRDIFRKLAPDHSSLENVDEMVVQGTVNNECADDLKRVKGGKGWSMVEEAAVKWI
jgi:hypothetical protein